MTLQNCITKTRNRKHGNMAESGKYVGKYVCYGNEDGGFCWGKIKSIGRVLTTKGEKDVLILTDRITCSGKPYAASNILHHDGDTILQLDKISPDRDIIDKSREQLADCLSDDELFILVMNGELMPRNDIPTGIMNMLESSGVEMKEVLRKRLEK